MTTEKWAYYEVTFLSNGTVRCQNCRLWSDVNPNFNIQRHIYFKQQHDIAIMNSKFLNNTFFEMQSDTFNESIIRFLNVLQ